VKWPLSRKHGGGVAANEPGLVMQEIAAVVAALDISHNPAAVHLAQRGALPAGMTFLLRIASGDAEAIGVAEKKTGRSALRLREAAGFFIEQVLLHPECDSYRVLGGVAEAPTHELRRNMALLLTWLHPDMAAHNGVGHAQLDRSVFANRITQAWENLKTEERRMQYDRLLAEKAGGGERVAGSKRTRRRRHRPSRHMPLIAGPVPHNRQKEDIITRLARFILGVPR
jgi:hypothetical protein